ncbi:putative arylesterase monooxygenase protein [Fusarium sporotrichioides]|uniref:Putative arylesterase monooxygenase protein n=1 Tax=Fusarium sporotrichioides TaxID=5514 RepID=A0A395RH32_FUSSP|nr:putative arylesterase monooxygenase protein [Fusarium sporotrichioides]
MAASDTTSQPLLVDPEYRIFKEMVDLQMQQLNPPPMETVSDIRNATDGMLAMVASTLDYPDGMQESVYFATSSLPSSTAPHRIPITRYTPIATTSAPHRIPITRYTPIATTSAAGPQRAILYIHGGGLIAGSADVFRPWAAELAERSGTQVFSVEYRLAPEFSVAPSCTKNESPAPFAVHDVLDALSWLQSHDTASELNIDPTRILLSGNSAGGAIAVGVGLLERDRRNRGERGDLPPIAGILLNYPMLDDRTKAIEGAAENDWHVFTDKVNQIGWQAYTGLEFDERNDLNVSYYTSPARCHDLSGMPPTLIDVPTLDLLKNEGIKFATYLGEANVAVQLNVYPGVAHGFDGQIPEHRLSKLMKSNNARFIGRF